MLNRRQYALFVLEAKAGGPPVFVAPRHVVTATGGLVTVGGARLVAASRVRPQLARGFAGMVKP